MTFKGLRKKYYSITSDHFIKFPSLISITSLCLVYNNSVVKPHQKIMWIWLKYKPLYYAVARNIKVCALVKMKKTIFSRKIGRDNKLHLTKAFPSDYSDGSEQDSNIHLTKIIEAYSREIIVWVLHTYIINICYWTRVLVHTFYYIEKLTRRIL